MASTVDRLSAENVLVGRTSSRLGIVLGIATGADIRGRSGVRNGGEGGVRQRREPGLT